jgi:hypothetical protein
MKRLWPYWVDSIILIAFGLWMALLLKSCLQ